MQKKVILKITPKINRNYPRLLKLKNKNISKVHKIKKCKSFYLIESEYFNGKPLIFNEIHINKKIFIKNIIKTIYFLIHNNLVHCDIRPSNILINKNNFKIIDFEYCHKPYSKFKIDGSVYIAPEVRKGIVHKYSDLYSLGIILSLLILNSKIDLEEIKNLDSIKIKKLLNSKFDMDE